MRILFCIEHYVPHVGGVEIVFQQLAEGLVRRGHQVTVVTTRLSGTRRTEIVNGVHVRRVLVPPFARRYFFTFFAIPAAWWLTRKADIVHTTTYNGAFPAWIAARLNHKPCVITVHEVLGEKWRELPMPSLSQQLHHLLERMVFALPFTFYSAVSYATLNRLAVYHIPTKKSVVIYNGVDISLFSTKQDRAIRSLYGVDERDFVFLYYGRPGVTKGIDVLVQSFHQVVARYPYAKLVLMLSGSPRSRYLKLLQMINQSPAREQVIKLDPVARLTIPAVLASADCVVIPSLTEGFGFTAVETAAAQIPMVVSRAGSLPEVVSGKVVWTEPGDREDLVRGLSAAIEGNFETIPAKTFLWEDAVSATEALYIRMIAAAEKS